MVKVSDDKYRTLSLTPPGRDMMTGRLEDVRMIVPTARANRVSWIGERRRRMARASAPAARRRWR